MSTINIYDLNYTDAFKLGIRNYANFNGRASRSEYWRFVAGVTLIQGLLGILALLCSNLGFPNYETLIDNIAVGVSLFFIVPNIAITTRRMHDIGRSGWTQLISFIPVIGFFIFLVYELRRGDERENWSSTADSKTILMVGSLERCGIAPHRPLPSLRMVCMVAVAP